MNPTFVGEAKQKRKREDELIGFRAIGDHGRTTLQRMLDVQRKPRLNGKSVQKTLDTPAPAAHQENGMEETTTIPPRKKLRRESSSSSDLLGTSSSDEDAGLQNAPLHVLLSSADGEVHEQENDSEPVSVLCNVSPTIEVGAELEASETEPAGASDADEGDDAFAEMPYTPTQVLPADEQLETVEKVETRHLDRLHDSAPEQTLEETAAMSVPDKSRRGVRFQSEVVYHTEENSSDGNSNKDGEEAAEENVQGSLPSDPFQVADHVTTPRLSHTSSAISSSQQPPPSIGNSLVIGRPASLVIARPVPSLADLLQDLTERQLPHKLYQDPYWSNPSDVPQHAFEYAGRRYTHQGDANKHLQNFDTAVATYRLTKVASSQISAILGLKRWEFLRRAPSLKAVENQYTALTDEAFAKPS